MIFLLVGFGIGLADAAWNAHLGVMQHANELLGLLHGSYGLGAVVSPLVATSLVTKAGVGWWYFYYLMVRLRIVRSLSSFPCYPVFHHGETIDNLKRHP